MSIVLLPDIILILLGVNCKHHSARVSCLLTVQTIMINRWALSRPLSLKEFEKLKKKQTKPEFLDMVPWYSGYVLLLYL